MTPSKSSLRMIAASLLAALFVTLTAAPREARADASEDKANLVAAFLKDVTFPGAVLARAKGVPTFAVLGEDELAIALTSSISAIDIAGKPVFVKFVRKPTDVAGAHVVFIASSAYAQVGEAIAAAGGALTIADNPGFIAAGGMLSFAGGRLNVAKAKVASAGYKVGVKALAAVQ